ncbi:MAG TPA: hypothetical protein DCY35_06330, partial [Prolixibacteraceae bacterium]|nr:hypothetical protein [Prolixibacteraceae bacterium]
MPKTQITIADYVALMHSFGYVFRLNEITDQVEINGIPLSDELFSKIQYQLIDRGHNNERYTRVAINATAYDNRYNPLKEYLSRLPYDGGHYFDALVACFDNPDQLFPLYLRKWMLGAIAKTIEGKQNRMLIMDGPQGIGKSLFVRWLCSKIPEYFTEGAIDADSKDTQIRLTTRWIWEVGELGSTFRRSDREALKNLITMEKLTFRRPYGYFDKTKPILANMIGTINNEGGFLDDPTGSRRFMVCEIKQINWKEYLKIDVNHLWGEIYAAYLIGEETEFTEDQKKQTELNNQKYEIEDPIEIVLRDKFVIRVGDTQLWTPTAELMYALQDKIRMSSTKAFQMALSTTMKKLGLVKVQQNNVRGYS